MLLDNLIIINADPPEDRVVTLEILKLRRVTDDENSGGKIFRIDLNYNKSITDIPE
jgi:hypothetical protein